MTEKHRVESTPSQHSAAKGGRGAKRTAVKPGAVLALAAIAGLIGGAYLLDLGPFGPDDGDEPSPQAVDAAVLPVETAYVQEEPIEETLNVMGTLYAYEQTRLSFKMPGYVSELHVQAGDMVEAGETVAELDDADFRLALRRAEADLQQARARLGLAAGDSSQPNPEQTSVVSRARAEMRDAERRAERIRDLYRTESASQSELDSAETELEVAERAYEEALETALERVAVLARREAEVDQARQDLENTVLKAPFDGIVREKLTGPGEYLEEGDPAYRLVRVDPLRLRMDIPERNVPRVEPGQPVRFRFEDGSETHHTEIHRLMPELEEDSRVLTVEAEVENPGSWRPGLFLRTEVVLADAVPSLTVPSDAVTSFVGIDRVFVVEADGTAGSREVDVGRTIEDRTVVREGLESGEEVILNPGNISSGDRVRVADREEDAPRETADAAIR